MLESAAKPGLLQSAYSDADGALRLRYSKVGNILALVLMPAGISLDFFVYRPLMWRFFGVRILADIFLGLIFLLHFTPAGRKNVRILSLSWAVVVQFSITYMIYISEGAMSPYYAGLNMVTLAVAVLSPWTYGETLFACMVTFAAYVIACLSHDTSGVNWGIFFNNSYFLILTDIICVTSSYFTSHARFNDFSLRHELDLRNKELAELDRLKSEFFANVSHEFRTPLTLIISPIDQILQNGSELPAQVRTSLTMVRENGLRLLKLITDLLEIVRLEDGKTQLKMERLELGTFLPAMVDSVRHLAQIKGLKLESGGDALEVEADPGCLEKIVLNILGNAIKFTPTGGAVRTKWRRENGAAVIEFADTGIGIADKDIAFVFDRFRQADGSSTRKYQGMGIGLALAKELVQEHKGKLTATSKLGSGTTFRLELPVLNGNGAAHAVPSAEAVKKDPIADIYSRANRVLPNLSETSVGEPSIAGKGEFLVLVVDDEPDMRRFLTASLAENYRVIEAADGRRGLELALKYKPDLALLDLMLPEINGLDLCRSIKQNPEKIGTRVVLLTARTDEASRIEALQRGADDFLTKPFSTLELTTRLANLLRSSKLEAEIRRQNIELQSTLKQLQETEAQLVQSEKMNALGSLSAGLLHEINNPLNFMMTALQIAQDSCRNDKNLTEILDDIGQGTDRIHAIVSDLRAFAYPSTANNREDVDISSAVETALRLVAQETRGMAIKKDLAKACIVNASKTQTIQVLVNLLINSAKALKAKGAPDAEICISTEARAGRLAIKVRDNGVGIDKSIITKIFDPFFTTRAVGDGMGLGLSICHTIVKNHGGSIGVNSEQGQWTEVVFDLPLSSREQVK